MLYKFGPMGYFGRVSQISRGPWFAELQVEDDGLEYYYMHQDSNGTMRYLLSNNMSYKDRTELEALWSGAARVTNIGWFLCSFVGLAAVTKVPYFRSMATGWRFLSLLGVAGASKMVICQYYSRTYGPLIGSYFRKYQNVGAADAWEIRDRKREFYQIDDSQYMAYTEEEVDVHRHANHGPQPDGEAKDNSYLVELNAFLDGKPNALKEHPRFLNYNYEFIDKSYPSLEQAKDLIEGKQ
eukprot:CAMPEP_0170466570 /NCGR_PEP_ID=MMETSP0123-20130129/10482_1 /TAXON_ID=182087 /ORGANISM="Favella ehrenbergii, Strain Fehren 1" /LENGTH=238 /DNA_ID=CAMNT_0010732735 /DNA_START=15 /DNA_END=731 /DNA_ORIENTATION=+